jgi:hypothetical protein
MLALAAALATGGVAFAAHDASKELKEMPVLTGEEWKNLQADSKLAFVWGIGHVVTIEENVQHRHPDLQRKGFVAKLAEGLRGVPMNEIVQRVDAYYSSNPDDLDLPVMRVIWRQIVKPKLASGIADRPLSSEDD